MAVRYRRLRCCLGEMVSLAVTHAHPSTATCLFDLAEFVKARATVGIILFAWW